MFRGIPLLTFGTRDVMKKAAHAYSALIQNRQFRALIARKKCGHFNEVERKIRSSRVEII